MVTAEASLQIEQPNRITPGRRLTVPSDLTRGGHVPPRASPATRGINGGLPQAPALDLEPEAAAEPAGLPLLTRDQVFAARTLERAFYRLDGDPRVLVLDMPDVVDQARVFARIVIFIERVGAPRSRILSVNEVKKWQAANKETLATLTIGNNIRADDFALFFNTARFQGESVTEDEQWLLARLLEHGVLYERNGGYESGAPEQIVISAPQPSRPLGCANCAITQAQRELILLHELAHARFITDQVYRNYVWWFWHNALSAEQKAAITRYLKSLGYDINAPDMLVNEMQAFVLHTPESEFFSSKAAGLTSDQLGYLRASFWNRYSQLPPLQTSQGYRLP